MAKHEVATKSIHDHEDELIKLSRGRLSVYRAFILGKSWYKRLVGEETCSEGQNRYRNEHVRKEQRDLMPLRHRSH